MPFACMVIGGDVRLRPSEPQAYQIFGARERHVYSVCSPVDANRCRNWMIHRFDVECRGTRVSWLSIAGAATKFVRSQAWVEDGQMRMALGPAWRQDGDVEGSDSVSLPPGFAPTLGMPVQFVTSDGVQVEDGNGPGARADGTWDAPARDARPDIGRSAQAAPPPGQAASPRAAPKAERTPPSPTPAKPPPAKEAAAPSAADQPGRAAAVASPAGPEPKATVPAASAPKFPDGAVVPTIINGPQATAAAAPSAPAAAPSPTPEAGSPSEPGPSAPEPTPNAPDAKSGTPDAAHPTTAVLDVSGLKVDGQVSPAIDPSYLQWGAVAGVGLLLLCAIYLVSRRNDGARVRTYQQRDLGAVNFETVAQGTTAVVVFQAASLPAMAPEHGDGALATTPGADPLNDPRSLSDALAILGTNADAPTEVIKKIVEGLRQSWHPDLAKSDEDRAYRDRRMQQLNAAWDIVLRSRRAAA